MLPNLILMRKKKHKTLNVQADLELFCPIAWLVQFKHSPKHEIQLLLA